MTAVFDTDVTDEMFVLYRKIGDGISSSEKLDPDWKALSIVFTFEDEGVWNFGYSYSGAGWDDWSAFCSDSDDDELVDALIRLREVIRQETGRAWYQGLFQLLRDQRQFKFEVTYDGETRWKVTPETLETVIRELRPSP